MAPLQTAGAAQSLQRIMPGASPVLKPQVSGLRRRMSLDAHQGKISATLTLHYIPRRFLFLF
jgi:hypothetical protein